MAENLESALDDKNSSIIQGTGCSRACGKRAHTHTKKGTNFVIFNMENVQGRVEKTDLMAWG